MPKYRVTMCRRTRDYRDVEVEARDKVEAVDLAKNEAITQWNDLAWKYGTSEHYEADVILLEDTPAPMMEATFYDPHGNVVDSVTGSPEEVSAQAAGFIAAQGTECQGRVEFKPIINAGRE